MHAFTHMSWNAPDARKSSPKEILRKKSYAKWLLAKVAGYLGNPRGEQLESRNQIVFECSVAQTLFKDVLSASLNPRRYAFLSGVDLHYP